MAEDEMVGWHHQLSGYGFGSLDKGVPGFRKYFLNRHMPDALPKI